MPPRYAHGVVLAAYAVYGAAVAARVGGGPPEIAGALLIGIVGRDDLLWHVRFPFVDLQKTFLAALLGTLAAFALRLVLPPFDAERALFGATTLLIPAMVVTIGTSELVTEAAVEAGLVRLAYALLRFLMLALGIVAAAKLWQIALPIPAAVRRTLSRRRRWSPSSSRAARPGRLHAGKGARSGMESSRRCSSPGARRADQADLRRRGQPLPGRLTLGVFAQLHARIPGHSPATILFPGLLQLAPGFLGTEAVGRYSAPSQADPGETFFPRLAGGAADRHGLLAASLVPALAVRPPRSARGAT